MSKFSFTRGFTLIELVVIMVIVGALALFVTGRFAERGGFEARGYYDELVAATRYAQRYAIASGCHVEMSVDAAGYDISTAAPCAVVTVQRPDGGGFSGTTPAGLTVSSSTDPFHFDAYGDVAAGGTVNVSSGGTAFAFTVVPGTGFVDTSP